MKTELSSYPMFTIPNNAVAAAQLGINSKYNVLYCDTSFIHPFAITPELFARAKLIRSKSPTDLFCASSLFSYLVNTLEYKRERGYKHGIEVWQKKQGVCGEMSFLYVGMARSVGLKASYVSVTKDCDGNSVRHACAGIHLHRLFLADIAYKQFDVKHKLFSVNKDSDVWRKYNEWK